MKSKILSLLTVSSFLCAGGLDFGQRLFLGEAPAFADERRMEPTTGSGGAIAFSQDPARVAPRIEEGMRIEEIQQRMRFPGVYLLEAPEARITNPDVLRRLRREPNACSTDEKENDSCGAPQRETAGDMWTGWFRKGRPKPYKCRKWKRMNSGDT